MRIQAVLDVDENILKTYTDPNNAHLNTEDNSGDILLGAFEREMEWVAQSGITLINYRIITESLR